MTFRKSLLLLISLSTIAALVACSSSSHPITVSVSSVPGSLTVNGTTPITATTTDSAGVTWSVACTPSISGACGSLSANASASGTAITYTAPPGLATGVVITATSVTDAAISAASTSITIGAATLADGTYVFSLTGTDFNDESIYHLAGAFTVAGGLITQGEQDFNDYGDELSDQINGTVNGTGLSTITTAADGNLQVTLVTCLIADCTQTDTFVGVAGTETLDGSIYPLNSAKAAITEYDGSATASGTLDTQDSTAFTAGTAPGPLSVAFVVSGYDQFFDGGFPFAMGGILNIDGAAGTGTISGTGSIFDANDAAFSGLYPGEAFSPSSISAPDTFGRVTITLDTSVFQEMIFAGYIVNANKTQLVETGDSFEGTLGGVAFTQAAVGGFTAAGIAGNTYVIGMQGQDTSYFLQAVNQLTLNADFSVSGFVDYADLTDSSAFDNVSPDPVTATAYAVDGAGAGDVTIAGLTDGVSESGLGVSYNLQVYLDGNGHALAISMDSTDVLAGPGFQQSGGGSFAFSGPYAMGATGVDVNGLGPFDAVGPQVADGVADIAGFSDVNWLNFDTGPFVVADETVSGSFTSSSNGVFSGGTMTGLDLTTCTVFTAASTTDCTADAFSYYLYDATGDNIMIETDNAQLTIGYSVQQ